MKQLVKSAIKKSFNSVGLDIHRKGNERAQVELEEGNLVVPRIWNQPAFRDMIPFRIESSDRPLVILGNSEEIEFLRPGFAGRGRQVKGIEWNWPQGADLGDIPPKADIIVSKLPLSEANWRTLIDLKERYGKNVIGIQELALPFSTIQYAQALLTYSVESLAELGSYYSGKAFFGEFFEELNRAFPLAGKRVIEFGPMEGAQTAGLVNLGVASVIAIEARAVSFIKTMIARYCFGWDNVTLVMDDFHNADSRKYGTFDLAFAHGVYYHSFAPFLFFENLMTLSDRIFIGGYCTGPSIAGEGRESLEYEGRKYLVKRIEIGNSYNNAVNTFAYHFSNEDLVSFFRERKYDVQVMMDEKIDDPWGERYIQFLATKTHS
jgi:hypothetical protein